MHFNPDEQDEENYRFQHENVNHFQFSELDMLADLDAENFDCVS
jgi:hypothetical protein